MWWCRARSHTAPVVVAFDGSDESQAAVRAAATLFGDRPLVVVSVWEPALAYAMSPPPRAGLNYPPPSPEEVATVDRLQREHAAGAAESGVRIARELGAQAEAVTVADAASVAETVRALAEERDAAAIVVGSRGLGRVKSSVLGSTSRKLLGGTRRPLLVVRADE